MTRQPTILISINTSWNIYNFRAPLVRALQAQGYRVISAAPDDAYTARLATITDAHTPLPMQNAGTSPPQDALLFLRYLRLLRRTRPMALLTYTIKPNIYGSLAAHLLGIPVINNVSGLGTAFLHPGLLTRIVMPLYWLAFRWSSCVFFQNTEDRDLFVQRGLVQEKRTAVLPGSGIDLDAFHPDHSPAPDAPIAFVLIARLLWDKGIGEFVAAARIVNARHPHIRFRLVGPNDVQNKTAIPHATIDQWVREGVIDYLGETDAVREVIAAHHCVVLPSYREGLSRVLLEAAAMGKPLIATDVAGCRQAVDHGSNGLLCRVADAQDLADTMLQFLALSPEERAAMGRKSREKAEQAFDQRQIFDAYLARIAAIKKHEATA